MKPFILFSLLILSGCQAMTFPVVAVSKSETTLPDASLFLMSTGSQYASPHHRVGPAIYRQLSDSAMFTNITINNPYSPLKIYVDFRDASDESSALAFSKMMVSAATLFLVPVTRNYDYSATFNVVFLEKNLRTYTYHINGSGWVHMFLPFPAEVQAKAAESMVNQFINDFSTENNVILEQQTDLNSPAKGI